MIMIIKVVIKKIYLILVASGEFSQIHQTNTAEDDLKDSRQKRYKSKLNVNKKNSQTK